MQLTNENEAYAALLYHHLLGFAHRLREVPPERWEWQIEPAAPSPRILAEHAWQWLVCDRQHIYEPDALKHSDVPEPPADQQAMCDRLMEEAETWKEMILKLTPEQLDEPRRQFNHSGAELNVRWFLFHMIQNTIYKHGQFATIYFALGLDGTEPYTAPFPNPIYAEVRQMARA